MNLSAGSVKEEALYKPFTLKRLTDYDPSVQTEGTGSLITGKQLKEDIFENIDMLFNSRSHASTEDLHGSEEMEQSVLGYGISDFCGRQSSTASREGLRNHIFRQIGFFEPRLDPASLTIELQDIKGGDSTSIEFKISGNIKVKGVDEEIAFISRLNLESGNADLRPDTNK
jgi:type VI secretion system lysozyme-like protein